MADLTIDALTASSAAGATRVRAELTDFRGTPVVGFTANQVIVLPSVYETDALGQVTLDLVPNEDITPTGTFYTISIGPKHFLIEKSGATQTLQEALAIILDDLGSVGAGLNFLTQQNNLSDVDDVAESRDNLGLGNSATLDVGTVAGTVAAGDDPRIVENQDHATHTNRDAPDQHPATSVSFDPYLGISATEVQGAIEQVYNEAILTLDEADEISFAPSGTLTSTNVQDAIVEARLEAQPALDHITDALDAHDASAISFVPDSPLVSSNVQDALNELLTTGNFVDEDGFHAGSGIIVTKQRVTGDPHPRWDVDAKGEFRWGSGLIALASTNGNLRRNTTSSGIKTDSQLAIAGSAISRTASDGDLKLRNIFTIKARNFADSGDVDVMHGATDDTITFGGNVATAHVETGSVVRLDINATTTLAIRAGSTRTVHVSANADNTAATAGIHFGLSADTNLYRSAANTLTTDDTLTSGTGMRAPFFAGGTNSATSGEDRHSNDGRATWRNSANSADIDALWVNTGNDTVLNAATGENVQLAINGTAKVTVATSTVTLADAFDIVLGTTTGTKLGASAAAKLGFWGATPVVQPSSTGETAGVTSVIGGVAVDSNDTFTGNVGTKAYTLSDIVKHLKAAGILATS